ncbi:hypothetical protein Leryth_013369 [Lithospermum erythrorhizon]|nr:hypothetical protein Leryth_013369 [Lithospermum erythrorhizon]
MERGQQSLKKYTGKGPNSSNLTIPSIKEKMSGYYTNLGTTLPNNYGASLGSLITKNLDPKSLTFGITSILGTTSSFLMSRLNS